MAGQKDYQGQGWLGIEIYFAKGVGKNLLQEADDKSSAQTIQEKKTAQV